MRCSSSVMLRSVYWSVVTDDPGQPSVPSSRVKQPENYTLSLKMGPIGCPEISVTTYQSLLHNTTEDRSSFAICRPPKEEEQHWLVVVEFTFSDRVYNKTVSVVYVLTDMELRSFLRLITFIMSNIFLGVTLTLSLYPPLHVLMHRSV